MFSFANVSPGDFVAGHRDAVAMFHEKKGSMGLPGIEPGSLPLSSLFSPRLSWQERLCEGSVLPLYYRPASFFSLKKSYAKKKKEIAL